ncbi:glycoside hydrolase superfamily [Lophiotrema nucula]|uniref:chitinase n=1 Tax=Lophiotrema nucula TaxID=690887 RepID=A0A6A5ZDH1_9PLEO|nr:glycoside hydrolase superfamily [Lophiotrema nucula]
MMWTAFVISFLTAVKCVLAGFNANFKSNIVMYWGQDSANLAGDNERLSKYCDDVNVDVFSIAFLTRTKGAANVPATVQAPSIPQRILFAKATLKNFANQGDAPHCAAFPGTELLECKELEEDIKTCQSKNKTILLSIGGDRYQVSEFSSSADATNMANTVWDIFGPPNDQAKYRPFGSAAVDGIDLDFEHPDLKYLDAFAAQLRKRLDQKPDGKTRFLTAAPQCPFPDIPMQSIFNTVAMDFLMIQFYNNPCGVTSLSSFNMEQWDSWASAKNKSMRLLMGVPGGTKGGLADFQMSPNLKQFIDKSKSYASFGGVMVWDVSQAMSHPTEPGFVEKVKGMLRA